MTKKNPHWGSTLDSFLTENGIRDVAHAAGVMPEARRPGDRSPEAIAARHARLTRHVQAIAAMPVLDPRSITDMVDDLNNV